MALMRLASVTRSSCCARRAFTSVSDSTVTTELLSSLFHSAVTVVPSSLVMFVHATSVSLHVSMQRLFFSRMSRGLDTKGFSGTADDDDDTGTDEEETRTGSTGILVVVVVATTGTDDEDDGEEEEVDTLSLLLWCCNTASAYLRRISTVRSLYGVMKGAAAGYCMRYCSRCVTRYRWSISNTCCSDM